MIGAIGNKKLAVVLLCAAATATLVVALSVLASKPARAATDVLPDLGMAHPKSLQIENTADGRKLLRFSSIVVNVGAGPFEVHGERADTTTDMSVRQRIYDDAGGYRDVPTEASMYFGGDGHDHWHVRDLEDYVLTRLDNGSKVGTGAKHGFCFFDNYLYGSSNPAFYKLSTGSCGGGTSATQTMMGLSVGWGDKYGYRLPDQYIDITGLTSGRYRLRATANADNWFSESDNTNNFAWVNIKISGDSVSVLRYGPAAQPI